MAIFLSGTEARLGTLNIPPIVSLPPLPNIVSEWTALMPLVVHLASYRDDYLTAGEVALSGRMSVGLFPRLGTLKGLARLLLHEQQFLDHASSKSGSSRVVWDVRWGSVFPCANGAASAALIQYSLSRQRDPPNQMPEAVNNKTGRKNVESKSPCPSEASTNGATQHSVREVATTTTTTTTTPPICRRPAGAHSFRRYQNLHVLRFERVRPGKSVLHQLERLRQTGAYNLLVLLLFLSMAAGLIVCGIYGTAAMLLTSATSRLVCLVPSLVNRPADYLLNNEAAAHHRDACMLVSSHPNALEWYLLVGDRGIIDTILNKPMFLKTRDRIRAAAFAASWFQLAHLLQLTAMTFTAAQKGWDGVALIVLVAVDRTLRWYFRSRIQARHWLEREGIHVKTKSFVFSGRGPMVGAIQLYSGSTVTRWMDDIFVPHPRRDAWLSRLQGESPTASLDKADLEWVERTAKLSFASAAVLRRELDLKLV